MCLLTAKNRLLFATRANGIYELTGDGTVTFLYPVDQAEIEFKSIAEDENGSIGLQPMVTVSFVLKMIPFISLR